MLKIDLAKLLKGLLLLSVLITIGFLVSATDFSLVWSELSKVGYHFAWILCTTFLAYLFGTLSWRACLGAEAQHISIFQLFAVRQVGETIGLYNPTNIVGGDLLKIHYLAQYHIETGTATSSVITSRCTTILSQIHLFVVAFLWMWITGIFSHWSTTVLVTIGVLIILLGFLQLLFFLWIHQKSGHKQQLYAQNNTLPSTGWRKFAVRIQEVIAQVKTNYQRAPGSFWKSYIFASIHWIIGSIEFYLILQLLGYDRQLIQGLMLDMSVIVFKSIGAFVPGQIGIEELGNKLVLTAVGISSASLWISVSILRRARQLVWIVVGFFLYLCIKTKLKRLSYE